MSGCSPFEFVLLVLMHQGATPLQIKKRICEGVVIRSLQGKRSPMYLEVVSIE
jgi:hypothetical protein